MAKVRGSSSPQLTTTLDTPDGGLWRVVAGVTASAPSVRYLTTEV